MKNLSLKKQAIIISLISILSMVFAFFILLPFGMKPFNESQNDKLESALSYEYTIDSINDYNDLLVIYYINNNYYYSFHSETILTNDLKLELEEKITDFKQNNDTLKESSLTIDNLNTEIKGYIFTDSEKIIAIYQFDYLNYNGVNRYTFFTRLIICSIFSFLIGLSIFIIWSSRFLKKINNINNIFPNDQDGISNEIIQIEKNITSMFQKILQQQKSKTEMIQNISHDLKTPVAIIKSYSEALQDGVLVCETKEENAKIILDQANHLSRKIEKLMILNKLEYLSNENLDKTNTANIIEVINKLLPIYENIAPKIKFNIIHKNKKDLLLKGSYENWEIVMENILENCTKFAESKIDIEITDSKLTVYNDGQNISNEVIENINKPYEKDMRGSFGLGLVIISKTLSIYGYKIEILNTDKGVKLVIS